MAIVTADAVGNDDGSTTCAVLNHDALAEVLALARPRDAVAFAQSCRDLHHMHQALKANLKLKTLQDSSSRHTLGVAPDTAYVELLIPDELVSLAERHLTAFEIRNVVLSLRPEMSRIQSFILRMFRDDLGRPLRLRLLVPGSILLVTRRFTLAAILRALIDIVTRDLKAAMSAHAQSSQLLTSLKVFFDLDVSIRQAPHQKLGELYTQIEQHLGHAVLQTLLHKDIVTCGATGAVFEFITWKETGLAALFGRVPSVEQPGPDLGVSTIDCSESGSAQLWRFTCLASQIVPVESADTVVDWV